MSSMVVQLCSVSYNLLLAGTSICKLWIEKLIKVALVKNVSSDCNQKPWRVSGAQWHFQTTEQRTYVNDPCELWGHPSNGNHQINSWHQILLKYTQYSMLFFLMVRPVVQFFSCSAKFFTGPTTKKKKNVIHKIK